MTTYELDMNRLADGLAGCGKIPRSPFDKLRANGTGTGLTLNDHESPVYGGLNRVLTPTCGSQA